MKKSVNKEITESNFTTYYNLTLFKEVRGVLLQQKDTTSVISECKKH